MRFDSIADNGKTVELRRISSDGICTDELKRNCIARPTPDFTAALQAFAAPVRKALGLPAKYELDVRSVTTRPDEEDNAKAIVISCVHTLSASSRPLNVNTPLLDLDNYPDLAVCLETLFDEAEQYYLGKKREAVEPKTQQGDIEDGLSEAPPQSRELDDEEWHEQEEETAGVG